MDLGLAECLARVRQQDQAAARSLVDQLYPLVIKIVRANRPFRAAEEDLAQEIFVKIFVNLESFTGAVPIEHWVSRIAVNHCLNALRHQKVRKEVRMADLSEEHAQVVENAACASSDHADPEAAAGAKEIVEMLLETLNPADRLVIRMLELEDRSIVEIAKETGWSKTLVRVRAFRARQKLNKTFRAMRKEGRL